MTTSHKKILDLKVRKSILVLLSLSFVLLPLSFISCLLIKTHYGLIQANQQLVKQERKTAEIMSMIYVIRQEIAAQNSITANNQTLLLKQMDAHADELAQRIATLKTSGTSATVIDLEPSVRKIDLPPHLRTRNKSSSSEIFGGIGIKFTHNNGKLYVDKVFEGSPAEKAGLYEGDTILEIDGQSVVLLKTSQISEKIRGEEGTSVTLSYTPAGAVNVTKNVSIVRKTINMNTNKKGPE